jgi:predicted amidophosphoribosyltransferase
MEEGAVAGACPSCGAPHSRGALYCWQCGATLMERRPSSAIPEDE